MLLIEVSLVKFFFNIERKTDESDYIYKYLYICVCYYICILDICTKVNVFSLSNK